MMNNNQGYLFGTINRSQLRKRTNLSVDSLASFNIKADKDIHNLSFDLENLSIHHDNANEGNTLEYSKNNNTFQYSFLPSEILP